MKKLREALLLILGGLSLVYYIVCVIFAHAGVSWLWIWLLLSGFCVFRAVVLHLNVPVPKAVTYIYRVGLVIAVSVFVITEGMIISAMTAKPEAGLDYVITLGAAVRNGVPTTPLMLRIEKTAEYLIENPDTKVIASGGQGVNESMSEAESIKENLIALGIDESRIICESRSTSTEENIAFSFDLIPEGASVGVVTNSFHVYRAVRIAELQGCEVSSVPARTLLPLGIHYTVREFFAVAELELKNLL